MYSMPIITLLQAEASTFYGREVLEIIFDPRFDAKLFPPRSPSYNSVMIFQVT